MQQRDWVAWHGGYDEPGSSLSRRLEAVQKQIREALDRTAPGRVRALSLCAGQGRDLLGVLGEHPRRDEVTARLVELDPANVRIARERAAEFGLTGVEAVEADAALVDSYAGAAPADLVLACGVFGNITDEDVERTISMLPQLCAPGATVVWTRNRRPPDLTPDICRWFEKYGFEYLWASPPHHQGFGVGAHQYTGAPASVPLQRGARMFTFVGYDVLRKGAPWPT
jgi:ubiquinone/menaquinone biosynthesis C-methylase UbiE